MIIAVGSLVYIKTLLMNHDTLCVILSEARAEFIGLPSGHYYYQVYCFETGNRFLAFDYEMTHLGIDGREPYFSKG
jgi:hypothetical protein